MIDLFDTGQLLFIGQGVVIISVLVNLGQERVQKIDMPCTIMVKGVSLVRRLVTKQ